mgnify:CR=1 FL=1
MHVLDIVGQPGDQSARRLVGEKAEIEIEDMIEKLLADAMHHRLADPFEQNSLDESKDEPGCNQHADKQADFPQSAIAFIEGKHRGRNIGVDTGLHEVGQAQRREGDPQRKKHRDGNRYFEAPAVFEDPQPESEIIEGGTLPFFHVAEITHGTVLPFPASA